MSDIISRQDAIDYCYQLINVEHEQGSDEMNYGQERVNQTETILHHLEFMPSAEPKQKTGKWIYHPERKNIYGGMCIECSECGETYMVMYIEDEKYCRNCGSYNGARMECKEE